MEAATTSSSSTTSTTSTTSTSSFVEYYKNLPSYLSYTNDTEYRNSIRYVFQMDTTQICPYADLTAEEIDMSQVDDVSKDEMQYDMKSMDIRLSELFELTKEIPLFQDLYTRAAARMFSEDRLIGQVVLCAYDNFALYYSVIWFFLHGGVRSVEMSNEYQRLSAQLK
jgi:hypothetical protein